MYYLNKIVGAFVNPMGIGLALAVAAALASGWRGRFGRPQALAGRVLAALAVAWLWVWSCGVTGRIVGLALEREFPPQAAEAMPEADAIVVLGGGIATAASVCRYAELQAAGDRAWHGARLYRAGKAKRVFATHPGDIELMADLGVPGSAIAPPTGARNTEEEARAIAEAMVSAGAGARRPRILLVTSAWHMRRALLMFERYAKGVETVPAAADHESTALFSEGLRFTDFLPDSTMLVHNSYRFKELIAYWGYRWLRR